MKVGLLDMFKKYPIEVDIVSVRAGKEEIKKDKARYVKKKNGETFLWLKKSKEAAPPTAYENVWKYTNVKARKLYLAKYGAGFYDPIEFEVVKGQEFKGRMISKGDELNFSKKLIMDNTRKVNTVYSEPSFFERYGAFITAIIVLVLGIIFMWVTVKNLQGVAAALGDIASRLAEIA